jgi:lipoprotein-anchoring transpeptidase ErfK/SrfK
MERMRSPARRHNRSPFWLLPVVVLVLIAGFLWWHQGKGSQTPSQTVAAKSSSKTVSKTTTPAPINHCASNTLAQNIIVSITSQHEWACAGSTQVYDDPVITGMELYPADLTPPGVYKIYAKETDLTLNGSDSTGSWSDPVSYWMPFLDNQYGVYGFHDATWRSPTDFGNVNINNPYTATAHGSHGCVELPLTAAKWLYDWAHIGTTVTVES